jgi:DNA-binding response OmpR family regulator
VIFVQGKRILVVEDEALLALDLRCVLEEQGASVVGPCYRLQTALSVAAQGGIDGAVLDVDLAGETVFPVADVLSRSHVPFVFHTGRPDTNRLKDGYLDAAVCSKPSDPEEVVRVLSALLHRTDRAH